MSRAGVRQARFGRKANYKPELVGFHSVFTLALSSAQLEYYCSVALVTSGFGIRDINRRWRDFDAFEAQS
jgi:hypothetical protein